MCIEEEVQLFTFFFQDSKSGKSALHYLIERGDLPLTGFLITEVKIHVCFYKIICSISVQH